MANEYLKRQPTSSGNSRKWTVSFWMKNSDPTQGYTAIMGAGKVSPTNVYNEIFYNGSQTGLNLDKSSDPDNYNIIANPLLRDPSSWMHVVVSFTDQGDNANTRVKFYINGAFTDHNTGTNLDVSETSFFNHIDYIHYIGSRAQQSYGTTTFDAQYFDVFLVDGQALTADVFGFYKEGKGYQSSGSSDSTDFGPGQWSPHSPRKIKTEIERKGGFGVNGFYLPMNDSSNVGADFHTTPNSIIKLKGEDLPQPRNGAPTTSDAFVSQLRQETGSLGFDGVVAFDGNGDYLSIPSSGDFALGTGDWTIEYFAYPTSTTQYQRHFYLIGSNANQIEGIFANSSGISFGKTNVWAPTQVSHPLYRWNHYALVHDSTNMRLYINGNQVLTSTDNFANENKSLHIGYSNSTFGGYFTGFMSNFRVVKGTALYTSNFTAPTGPLTSITNTKLLCCNSSTSATASTVTPGTITANGNASATRNELTGSIVLAVPGISGGQGSGYGDYSADIKGSGSNKTVTASGNAGVTATPSYYGSAMTFDGSGDVLTLNNDTDFHLGSGDYTIECWINPNNFSGIYTIFALFENTPERAYNLELRTNGTPLWQWYETDGTSGANINPSVTLATGQWTHLAAERYGTNTTLYVNGVAAGTNTTAPLGIYSNTSEPFTIGALRFNNSYAQQFPGKIQDLRFYKGVAKYKGGFDVPKPYTPVGIESWRQVSDTCKNNFATLNPIDNNSGVLSNGNLTYGDDGSNGWNNSRATIGASSGKWYWEMRPDQINQVICASVAGPSGNDSTNGARLGYLPGQTDDAGVTYYDDGKLYHADNQNTGSDWGAAYFEGDIIGIALDMDDSGGKVWFSRNGSWQASGNPSTGSNPARSNLKTYADTYFPTSGTYYANTTQTFNFGQNPTFGNIAALNKNRINSSTADSVWHQSSNTGTHTDWTVSSGGTELDVAVPSGHYARVKLRSADGTIDPKKTYLLSFKYTTGPSNLGVSNDQGYMTAVDGSVSPNGLSSGNFYSFVIHGTSEVSITGFTGSTYALDTVVVSEIDECYTDDSGKGKFHYQPPTGFLALCEDNLPTPAIADPGEHFKTVLWSGDGNSGRSITGVGFKPDFVWLKSRTNAASHRLSDSVRGINKQLMTNTTEAEATFTTMLTSFDSDGFTIGDNVGINGSGYTNVAWCWKAGGAAVSNTDGTITSQVSANQTAGFSIVSYTGNGTSGTVGHGLGKTPNIVICKNRTDASTNWSVNGNVAGLVYGTNKLLLQATNAIVSDTNEVTGANATTITLGNSSATNDTNDAQIAYCWTEIEGFSKFGSYVGNGNADGPFVYCGFKPAWVMIKSSTVATNWYIFDNSRKSTNPITAVLFSNTNDVETNNAHDVDFVSNGFKVRQASGYGGNNDGASYLFMAFAESPFQTANAK